MTDMAKIITAAQEYTRLLIAEYPPAEEGGLAVSVFLDGDYMLTLTPSVLIPADAPAVNPLQAGERPYLPAPEELLLHGHTEVSNDDE